MDAIAVTIAADAKAIGLASLGTSLTDEQAAELPPLGRTPVVATDADRAGQVAVERDYWILTPYGIDPLLASLPDDSDPADLVADGVPGQLAATNAARPMADALVDAILSSASGTESSLDALRLVAAQPSAKWAAGVEHAEHAGFPSGLLQAAFVSLVHAWSTTQGTSRSRSLPRLLGLSTTSPGARRVAE